MTTLAEVERRQRYALAADLCAGRRVLLLTATNRGHDDDVARPLIDAAVAVERLEAEEFLAKPHDEPPDAIVCIDDHGAGESLLERLHECTAAGMPVLLALRGAVDDRLAAGLPAATHLYQHAVELAWLRGSEPGNELSVPAPEAEPGAARWTVLAFGFDPAAVATATDRIDASTSTIHFSYLTALEASQKELLRANARLSSTASATQTAAAAAIQAQILQLREQVVALEGQLADAIESARHNDEMLRAARVALQSPSHRAVESLRYRVVRVPLLGRVIRSMWRVVARVYRPPS